MYKKSFLLLTIIFFNNYFAQINFLPVTNVYTQKWPQIVKIVDINNDGLNDVILGLTYYDSSASSSILIFLQDQNGTLQSPITLPYFDNGKDLYALEIGDLNQDGLKDIAIGYSSYIYGSNYGIFFQKSDNRFNNLISYDAESSNLQNLKIADLNNDGVNDVVVSTYRDFYFLYQLSPGKFTKVVREKPYLIYNYASALNMEVADVNNDGKVDIITNSGNGLYIYLQDNSLYFSEPVITPGYGNLTIADINNDSKNDIIMSRIGPGEGQAKIGIKYQIDSPTLFSSTTEIPAYEIPGPVRVADLNNDGKKEIITVHQGWVNASFYEQDSNGNYSSYKLLPLPYASSYDREGLAVGDINNDNKKDIVIANYNRGLDILYNSSYLSTYDFATKEFITIYPNPSTDFIFIKSKISYNSYKVVDFSGRIVQKGVINNNKIDIRKVLSGKYLLEISDNNGALNTSNFVKK
ncbi:T9SS type A sorting domain-containing protein [Epilithonimonas sp.]|uniref:T9SS type A sorting domain-containing protein n=1 Tax=Epilithonimonas sp. TaxID=2894511 RepID=UPI0028A138A8|nr:T9SS type A sorting domain-containing protein [Epilithonimonas sp.]